jgi:D-alanyl-D-alanine carboxypeptidase
MGRRLVIAFACAVVLALVPAGTAVADGHHAHHGHRHRSGPFPPAIAAKLQQAVTVAQQGYAVPGMAVLVDEPGVGHFEVTAGDADIASHTPVTTATHFRIGSVTKTFTATIVLQLVQEHRLSLSEDIDRWFPQLPYAEQITIGELLSMHSGIYDEGGSPSALVTAALHDPSESWTPDQIVAFAIQDGSQPPGTPGYSDTNYVLLAAIASSVTHTPFPELLERRILRPLHLDHTSFPTTSLAMPSPAATPYAVGLPGGHPEHAVTEVATTFNPSMLGGAGAMISTLPDVARWARALGSGELLAPKTERARLQLETIPKVGPFGGLPGVANDTLYPATYGLGIASIDGFLGHNGIVNGFTSDAFYDPATRATVVVLFNSEIFTTAGGAITGTVPVSDALFTTIAEILQGQA